MASKVISERAGWRRTETPLNPDEQRDAVREINEMIIARFGLENQRGDKVSRAGIEYDGKRGPDLITATITGVFNGDHYIVRTFIPKNPDGTADDPRFEVLFPATFRNFGVTKEGLKEARKILSFPTKSPDQ